MRLFIAEKPSLARAIAAALPGPQKRGQGVIQCGSSNQVTWCIGHLLEPVEPAAYDPRWRQWHWKGLPVFPPDWRREPREKVREQLERIGQLLSGADTIVHAGDPDREGQLLVDEVLQWFGVSRPVQRLLVNDLNPAAVKAALERLRPNSDFQSLGQSAEARQQADWLYGINLSRACTLFQRQQGQRGVFSVGRVQTPVLGLVARRDRAIENFQPYPYFVVQADFQPEQNDAFSARWLPDPDRHASQLDDQGRLTDEALAETVRQKVTGQEGRVLSVRFDERDEAAPLPLSLSVLQIEAAQKEGLSAQQTLEAAQALYERHQLITYPRSDCRYLPEGHFADRHRVLEAIASNQQAPPPAQLDPNRRSKAWDDRRVEAHHAIIPTAREHRGQPLPPELATVYDLVCRYYRMQFMPPARHRDGEILCEAAGERFRARETGLLEPGWKRLEPRRRQAAETPAAPLPRVTADTPVSVSGCQVIRHQARPPAPFTEASLLRAMTGIARYVDDPRLRRTLRETDGLGTEATRAGILETLLHRELLLKKGRHLHATPKGFALVDALPEAVTRPDMTAVWEATLEGIRRREQPMEPFLKTLRVQIDDLVQGLRQQANPPPTGPRCPQCRSPMRERKGRFGAFLSCSRYPECRGTREAGDRGNHSDGTDHPPRPCPSCYAPMERRQGKHGWFWGCSQFPGCRQTLPDTPDGAGQSGSKARTS